MLKGPPYVFTFKCNNIKCNKIIICLLTECGSDKLGRCQYCKEGTLMKIKNRKFKKE